MSLFNNRQDSLSCQAIFYVFYENRNITSLGFDFRPGPNAKINERSFLFMLIALIIQKICKVKHPAHTIFYNYYLFKLKKTLEIFCFRDLKTGVKK